MTTTTSRQLVLLVDCKITGSDAMWVLTLDRRGLQDHGGLAKPDHQLVFVITHIAPLPNNGYGFTAIP